MPKVLKTYKFRIYPDKYQQTFLRQEFGAARFVWNYLTANFNAYGTEEYISNPSDTTIKSEHVWLKEGISYSIQQVMRDFQEFLKQYFDKKRKIKLGAPKFKKKGMAKDSFRIPAQCIGYMKGFDFEKKTIRLPKMKKPIKVRLDRTFVGAVKNITFSRSKTDKYYISVLVETEVQHHKKTKKDIGIDLGIKHLATLSDGNKIENSKLFVKNQDRLKRAQQHLARKVKGSKSYNKQRVKVAKIHEKITQQRSWYYHNISSWIVKSYDSICLEDLNVAGMKKNRSLAKAISDAALSTLVSMIRYKSSWYGKDFLQVSRWFPSSKTCSSCGWIKKDLNLGDREWTCDCGISHDRDLNAARNILNNCLLNHHGVIQENSEEQPEYRHGETIRPSWFLNQKARLDEVLIQSYE